MTERTRLSGGVPNLKANSQGDLFRVAAPPSPAARAKRLKESDSEALAWTPFWTEEDLLPSPFEGKPHVSSAWLACHIRDVFAHLNAVRKWIHNYEKQGRTSPANVLRKRINLGYEIIAILKSERSKCSAEKLQLYSRREKQCDS